MKKLVSTAGNDGFLYLDEEDLFSRLINNLYQRLVENMGYLKKAIGPLSQLTRKLFGEEARSIYIKEVTNFPYVHSLRLLALKE
ncbi:hypothetical protein ACFSCX_18320 [Bacillus salitolerans]|uniref:Uncharacterized protein n=1 Tax=Bacillus salitolerans TaxID=1437434 RepID=A0ABW4LTP7_9BACI